MISTDIYLMDADGLCEKYAYRRFQQVPRVGEFVELRKNHKWECAEVVRVVHGEIEAPPYEQTCAIVVKWEKE